MTQPTTDEPISVRIARLKGCEPDYSLGAWGCRHDPALGHIPRDTWSVLSHPAMKVGEQWDTPAHEAWLAPAASFALLAEMVDAGDPFGDGVELSYGPVGTYYCGRSLHDEDATAPTLGEAVALAWIAWKAAQQ